VKFVSAALTLSSVAGFLSASPVSAMADSRAPVHHTSKLQSEVYHHALPTEAPKRVVTVQRGDCPWSISVRNHVSLQNLESWNGLNNYSVLHVGQKLAIYGAQPIMHILSGRSSDMSASLADGVLGEDITMYSMKFLGVGYRWGGDTPAGFDCSGFTLFTLAHFGIHVGRTSYDQYRDGTSVSENELIPGDLVFFNTDGPGASHVGIFIGSGKFVSAAGSGIRIDSINDPYYWSSHYVGARRVR